MEPPTTRTPSVFVHGLLGLLLVFTATYATTTAASEDTIPERLTLGVFPFLQTARLDRLFAPTASRLGELTGVPVTIRSSSDMQEFRERIKQQRYDLIFIQPFDYIRFAADAGYIPLARWSFKGTRDHPGMLNAVFVVRKDSPIHSIGDLQGKNIVAPPYESAVAILGELELRKQFPQHTVTPEYRPDHLSCLQQVATRNADVCICAAPPLAMFRKKHGIPLRTIHVSQWTPSSLYAIHQRIPVPLRQKLRESLLSWHVEHETDRQYLLNGVWSHLHPASDNDYDAVRTLWRAYQANQ